MIRARAVALTLALSAQSCDGLRDHFASKPVVARGLDVPDTLDALRARGRAGGEVRVTRQARTGFDFRCGHSAACLVVLPIAVVAAIVPPLYDEASLTRDGRVVFHGIYDLRGRLVAGVSQEGGVRRAVERVTLRELGRTYLVEISRATLLADGGMVPLRLPTLTEQIDLLPEYRRAIGETRSPDRRGRLVAEALQRLGAEALPLARERVRERDDDALAELLRVVCPFGVAPFGVALEPPVERALLDDFLAAPTPSASIAALRCTRITPADERTLRRRLTRDLCEAYPALALAALRALSVPSPEERCLGPRGPMVDALQGRTVDEGALRTTLARCDEDLRHAVLMRLDPMRHATVLLDVEGARANAVLARLAASTWVPDAAAGRVLLRRWSDGEANTLARIAVVDLVSRMDPRHAALLRDAVPEDGDAGAGRASLALRFALGERRPFAEVLRAMPAGHSVWCSNEGGPNFTSNPGRALFLMALWTAGCVEREVRAAEDDVIAGRAPRPCAEARPWPRPLGQQGLWDSVARQGAR